MEKQRKKRTVYSVSKEIISKNARGTARVSFANTLNQTMKERQIDQEELAVRTGLSTGVISNYRRGLTEPKLGTIVSIAECLGVDCDYLMRGIESRHLEFENLGLRNSAICRLLSLGKEDLEALSLFIDSDMFFCVLSCIRSMGDKNCQ